MTEREKRAPARTRVGLAVGLIGAIATLIWAARDSDAVAVDRQRDDETLQRARPERRESTPAPTAPEGGSESPAQASAVAAPDAPPPLPHADMVPLAAPRPTPPRELFQPRPPSPRGPDPDTGLVFSDRPPPADPAKDLTPRAPAHPPEMGARFPLAASRPRPPAAVLAPAHPRADRADRQADTGLVFSSRPPAPPEGFVKRTR